MFDTDLLIEILWVIVLIIYVFAFSIFIKKLYEYITKKGLDNDVAVYYNRKLVHIFAGGVVALLVPFVFSNPWFPLFCGLGLSIFTYIAHGTGHIMYWFQKKDDENDVSFCIMWALSIFIIWLVTGNPWISVIPALFMSIGDGVTGIIRNALYKKRSKHPIGNVFMLIVCVPIGYVFGDTAGIALWGISAGIIASLVERFEYKKIDDNIFITVFSSIIVYLGFYLNHM